MWNGNYYVTIRTPDGKVKRQNANKPLPGQCTIVATDNGPTVYRDMLANLRREAPNA